jgi:hypothetical protein
MPANGIQYNDGAVHYGSCVVTNLDNSDTYVAENVRGEQKLNVVKRFNEVGTRNGSVGSFDGMEGSLTLQLQNSSSKPPTVGQRIGIPANYACTGSAVTASLISVGMTRTMNTIPTVECTWEQRLN